MSRRRILTGSLTLLAFGLACAETTAPDRSASRRFRLQPLLYSEEGPQEPPPEAPPEYEWYTTIDLTAAAWFGQGAAWGQGVMNYKATNAELRVTLNVLKDGQTLTTNTGEFANSQFFPVTSTLSGAINIPVAESCGLTASATAIGEVWDQWNGPNGLLIWGKKKDTKPKSDRQRDCVPGGGGTETTEASYPDTQAPDNWPEAYWECDYYDEWVSTDGGQTWTWQRREYTGCRYVT